MQHNQKIRRHDNNNIINAIISSILLPIIPHGRQIITIDHASFLHESSSSTTSMNNNTLIHEYGAFLYHKPQYGLCCINTAIALTLITLHRRSSPMTLQQHQHNLHPNNSSTTNRSTKNITLLPPQSSTTTIINPQSIRIYVWYHNVYPTIQIHDVKTSNAYKFITLKGRIIKVYSKKLPLKSADFLCISCGHHFHHLFRSGKYELPLKCRANPPPSSSQQQQQGIQRQKKHVCRGQKFELVRRTAKYIDYQKLKLQEEDNFHHENNNNNNSSSGGGGGGVSSSSSPRSIDLKVTHDLVDMCHAGDCVKVVGTI
jgi:DNA replicative helicase MCM subunit Mcm2 (Cdc46/Mcm family)